MIDFSKKFDNVQGPDGGLTAEEFNNFITELENIAKQQGIALSADPAVVTQIAQAIFLAGLKSQSFIESGAVNTYMITPVMGVNGPLLPDSYTLLHGARVTFTAMHTNTGGATLNIGQNVAMALGAKPLKRLSGDNLAPNDVLAGFSYTATYDGNLSTWFVQVADAVQNQRLDSLEAQIAAFSSYPIGAPIPWPASVPPTDHLPMHGQAFNPSIYPKLALVYPSFILPDTRGAFIRGWASGVGLDSSRVLLSIQQDAIQNIIGSFRIGVGAGQAYCSTADGAFAPSVNMDQTYVRGTDYQSNLPGAVTFNASRSVRTSGETRPYNIAFNFVCRAK